MESDSPVKKMSTKESSKHQIAYNKKAAFNFELLDEFTAGIKLEGREIKSLRNHKPSFSGAYVSIVHGRPYLKDLNIPRYKNDSTADYIPKRQRLLLLKKAEIARLESKTNEKTVTIVPIEIFLSHNLAKVRIALARGKKKYDKRRVIQEREEKRRVQRVMKKY